jgi:hypothetical protein
MDQPSLCAGLTAPTAPGTAQTLPHVSALLPPGSGLRHTLCQAWAIAPPGLLPLITHPSTKSYKCSKHWMPLRHHHISALFSATMLTLWQAILYCEVVSDFMADWLQEHGKKDSEGTRSGRWHLGSCPQVLSGDSSGSLRTDTELFGVMLSTAWAGESRARSGQLHPVSDDIKSLQDTRHSPWNLILGTFLQ